MVKTTICYFPPSFYAQDLKQFNIDGILLFLLIKNTNDNILSNDRCERGSAAHSGAGREGVFPQRLRQRNENEISM